MTDENRRQNLQDALQRAGHTLAAATALIESGHPTDAVSRAYYAAFHALTGLLMSQGLEPRSHRGALHLFNVHFVRPGRFPTATNRSLAGMQRARELADYDASVRFDEADARAELGQAEAFVRQVEQHLTEEGWLPPREPSD